MPRAVVCLPTYNERENLERMLDALAPLGVRVLVIDDSSPDGTGELADALAAERVWVDVLHRERKEGLGPAYVAGFREVLRGDAELILEMDCDFSHSPADVPRLIAACEAGADLALGSRYVAGGGTEDWGLARRVVSAGGSLYARTLLGLPVRDLTGGFKCFRRQVLEEIDLDAVRSKGYAFQIELTYRALRAGFRVVEVPIVFSDRTHGKSKMSRGIFLEAVARVPALRLAAWRGTAVTDLDAATFDAAIAGGPLLVDFWAPWCRPCKALEPILAELDVEVARVNVDEEPGIASRYEVLSIPTVILFSAGKPKGSVVERARARTSSGG